MVHCLHSDLLEKRSYRRSLYFKRDRKGKTLSSRSRLEIEYLRSAIVELDPSFGLGMTKFEEKREVMGVVLERARKRNSSSICYFPREYFLLESISAPSPFLDKLTTTQY